jgi:hypothetical protein
MKSFKQIVCFAVVLLITMLFALQAAAELPRTREIRDKFMWGDPDEMGASRKAGGLRYIAVEYPDRDKAASQSISKPAPDDDVKRLCVNITLLGFEIRRCSNQLRSMRTVRR